MAKAFRRHGKGADRRFVATLDLDERDIVATLMEQVADLLEAPDVTATGDAGFDAIVAGMTFSGDPDEVTSRGRTAGGAQRDPALDRLLPTANREDPEAAGEFRHLTEGGIRHRKAAGLAGSASAIRAATGDDVVLDADQARAFLTALTDVRLVLGERLGLHTDEDVEAVEARADELGPDDPLVHAVALYDFLTWFQETLATVLLRR